MNLLSLFKPVRVFVFDVDGVLTDGTLLLEPGGEMQRRMHIRDGYALQLAVKRGYPVVVISGAESLPVKIRLQKLGLTHIYMSVADKAGLLRQLIQQNGWQASAILFMGDDMPDLEVMTLVGLPCAPADACSDIREVSRYISQLPGGMGAARDVIEKVLKLNHHWDAPSRELRSI